MVSSDKIQYISALHRKKNSRVLPDSKQIYEKNLINVQMYVMNDLCHTYLHNM